MVQEIKWRRQAVQTFNDIIEYLEADFSETEVRKFVDRVERKL